MNKDNEKFETGLFDLPELNEEAKKEETPVEETKTIDNVMESVEEKTIESAEPKEEIKEETPVVEETKAVEEQPVEEAKKVVVVKKKENKVANFFGLLASLIGIFAIVVFLFFLISSYGNFNDVKNGKKPNNYKEKTHYTKKGRDVTYYKYTIYKIEIIKYNGEVTYTLKPAFLDDY